MEKTKEYKERNHCRPNNTRAIPLYCHCGMNFQWQFLRRMSSNKKETNRINNNRYECIEGKAAHIENRFGITAGDVSKQNSGRSASIKLLMSPTVFLYVPTIYSLRSSSSSSSSVRYTVCRLSLLVSTVSSFPRELRFVYTDHPFSIYGNRAGRKKGKCIHTEALRGISLATSRRLLPCTCIEIYWLPFCSFFYFFFFPFLFS